MLVLQAAGQGMQTVTLYEPHSGKMGGEVRFIITGGSQAISGLPHTEGANIKFSSFVLAITSTLSRVCVWCLASETWRMQDATGPWPTCRQHTSVIAVIRRCTCNQGCKQSRVSVFRRSHDCS